LLLLLLSCWGPSFLPSAAISCPRRPKKKILDALEALSDDGSNEASSSASEEPEEAPQQQPAKKQKISLEDLQKQGYNSGPSVLYMKVPEEEGQQNWSW
jgi:hypothetical protein